MSALQGLTDARAATMEQLTLNLDQTPAKAFSCNYRRYNANIERVWCERGRFWTTCGLPFCGEPGACFYDGLDNTPEAIQRRRDWIKANG